MLLRGATFAQLRTLLRPQRRLAITVLVLGCFASLAEGIGIGLFIPLFQVLDTEQASMPDGSWLGTSLARLFEAAPAGSRIQIIALTIFGVVLLNAVLTFAATYVFTRLSAFNGHELRTRLFDEALTMDFGTLESIGTGDFLNILSHESWRTTDAITTFMQAVITLFTLAVYLTLLLLISWQLTLLVAGILLVVTAAVRMLTRKVSRSGDKMTRANAEVAKKMVDGLGGIEIIRGYGREGFERQGFAAASELLSRVTVRIGALSGAVYPIYEVVAAAILVTLLVSFSETAAGLAPLLVFMFLLYRLTPIVKRFERERIELLAAEAAIGRTFDILSQSGRSYLAPGGEPFHKLRQSIKLEQVGYCYKPSLQPALKGLRLAIPASGLTAIVGPSGAGKSTLIKLLLRFFDPTEGAILVDDKPLTDLDLADWRQHIAVVPQKVFLFNATVRENIAYGALDAADEQIEAAAKAAGAHDFITALPQAYDTHLGEDGVEISGGEGQRICLTRAMIRRPQLLLLDEATNALDSISEDCIQQALADIRQKCAVVVVAHRLATIKRADQILVLDRGELVEQGRYQELVAQGGLFTQLHNYASLSD